MNKAARFPLGHGITLAALDEDPYPTYRALQIEEPITWCEASGMYLLTRYQDVRAVLLDTERYVSGTEHSLISDTFGDQMLSLEGTAHRACKQPLLPLFRPQAVRDRLERAIEAHADFLIRQFADQGSADLRSTFASRLPVLTMLSLFGLPASDEPLFRGWYTAFERALSNFTWDQARRDAAQSSVAEFHAYLQRQLNAKRQTPDVALLSQMLGLGSDAALDDDAIRRNASIIFFGGISTVEALILNSLYVLTERPELLERLQEQPDEVNTFLDEVVRWSGPVQSATRHIAHATEIHGTLLQPGDTLNCMIAAANRDPEIFEEPERFNLDRSELKSHIGFAIGAHHCLGSHVAKLEARTALKALLRALPALQRAPGSPPTLRGFEFRQPQALHLVWETQR
ncbi:MAG: cytochrome P450 [Pseudomonadota bacterium]